MITPEQLATSNTEHGHQSALFQWAALNIKQYPQLRWLFAIPNGFFASSGQKSKMKAEGLRDGVPDVWLPVPMISKLYYGLIIEMKREIYKTRLNGGCTDDQLKWLAYLNESGYKAVVAYGWEHARDEILGYLNEK